MNIPGNELTFKQRILPCRHVACTHCTCKENLQRDNVHIKQVNLLWFETNQREGVPPPPCLCTEKCTWIKRFTSMLNSRAYTHIHPPPTHTHQSSTHKHNTCTHAHGTNMYTHAHTHTHTHVHTPCMGYIHIPIHMNARCMVHVCCTQYSAT